MPARIVELERAARGGIIALVGILVSSVFGFLTRTIVGRTYGPSEYGAYNVAFTIFSLMMTLVLFGFPWGLQRQVSYFREKTPEKTEELISTALIVIVISSVMGAIFIELEQNWLAKVFLKDEASRKTLVNLLTIIAIALPLSAVFNSLISVTQGFKRVREYFLYGKICWSFVYFLTILTIVIILRLPIKYTAVGYVITMCIALALFIKDIRKTQILPKKIILQPKLAKVLISFSIPLMLSGIVSFIMTWTDTLMLGHFKGSTFAGIYNAATPLARFIPVFLAAFTVIYSPIATSFYAREKIIELNEFYISITKWILLFTFPLFLLFTTIPTWTLTILFGKSYATASLPLVILAFGYMFHTIIGPNGLTLVSMGKPNQEMLGNIIGATLNVAANLILIPRYNMEGAATATAISYIVSNIYKSAILWRYGIKPFDNQYIKVVSIGGVITIIGLILPNLSIVRMVYIIIGIIIFYVGSLLLGAMDRNDVEVIRMMSKKLNLRIDGLINLIDRYTR